MKLKFKINFFNEDARLSVVNSELDVIEDNPFASYTCDYESINFSEIINLTKGTSGARYWPIWEFSKKEQDQAEFFLIRAQKLFHAKDADFNRNEKQLQEKETQNGNRVCILKSTRLVNLKINDNEILYDDAFEEIYTHIYVYEKLMNSGVVGLDSQKILKSDDGKFHKDYVKLHTERFFPPIHEDELLKKNKEGNWYSYFFYGSLAYNVDFDDFNLDFYKTNEPLGANDMPLFLCSKKMKNSITSNKIKGLRFKPVLNVDSEVYQAYINLWNLALKKIKENPSNQIC